MEATRCGLSRFQILTVPSAEKVANELTGIEGGESSSAFIVGQSYVSWFNKCECQGVYNKHYLCSPHTITMK